MAPGVAVTPEELDELDLALAARGLWKAPWTARSFEIDCPCPNGEHCGDTHSCEEVEAREEYPNGEPGDPADEGDGQCVVQISVPGLETFAKPTAKAICLLRNHAADLVKDARVLGELRDDVNRGLRIGDSLTLDTQSVEEMAAALVKMVRDTQSERDRLHTRNADLLGMNERLLAERARLRAERDRLLERVQSTAACECVKTHAPHPMRCFPKDKCSFCRARDLLVELGFNMEDR